MGGPRLSPRHGTSFRLRSWLVEGTLRRHRTRQAPHGPLVAGHVPDRRRLFLDARLSAQHRVPGGRLSLALRDAGPGRCSRSSAPCPSTTASRRSARTARAASPSSRNGCPDGAARRSSCACSDLRRPTSSSRSRCRRRMRPRTSSRTRSCPHWLDHRCWSRSCCCCARRGLSAGLPRGDLARRRDGRRLPGLNVVLIGTSSVELAASARFRPDWTRNLLAQQSNPFMMIGAGAAAVPEARAGPVGIRDRRRGDAAVAARARPTPTVARADRERAKLLRRRRSS